MIKMRTFTCERYKEMKNQESNTPSQPNLLGAETEVLAFLEELGGFVKKKHVPEYFTWSYYRFFVEIYWQMTHGGISQYRAHARDNAFFEDFEWLKRKFNKLDVKLGGAQWKRDFIEGLIEEEIHLLSVCSHSTNEYVE